MELVEAGGDMIEGDLMCGEVGEGDSPLAGGSVFSCSIIFFAAICLSLASSFAATLASLNFSTNYRVHAIVTKDRKRGQ